MKILDSGHRYILNNLDHSFASIHHTAWQQLYFVKREGPHYPGNIGAHPGTTQQEVLRALIDRATYVNGQISCPETEAVIACYKTALLLLEIRAARVKDRRLPYETIAQLESAPTCPTCGHVDCHSH